MSKHIHVVINPAAGQDEPILSYLNQAFKKKGVSWDASITHTSGDALTQAQQAIAKGADIICAYGGDGNRVLTKRKQGSTTNLTSYVYDVNQPLPVVIQDTWHPFPSETRKYVWGLGLLYMVEDGDAFFYHQDNLGSVRAVTNEAAEMDSSIQYEDFGFKIEEDNSSTQPFGFTGEVDDNSFGFVDYLHLRARHYNPFIGRFLSRDSYVGDITRPLSLNRYTYTENNPVNYVDPSGMAKNKVLHPCKQVSYSGGAFPVCIPDGVSLDANIHRAQLWRYVPYLKHLWFTNQVREGGVWDYKRYGESYEYADFGNFHYGVIGAAMGYSEHTLLIAGGAVQQATNAAAPLRKAKPVESAGIPLLKAPYGDTAEDQYWISQGYQYYMNNYR